MWQKEQGYHRLLFQDISRKEYCDNRGCKRIEDAVRELAYTPVYKQKNPGVIAVLIPNLKLAYFSEVLKELLEAVPKYGYRMVFIPVTEQGEAYKQFFKELDITGVIYLEENADQDMLNYIAAKNIKTVMFGAISADKRCKMIHINDWQRPMREPDICLSCGIKRF